ncbi:hypothetical protein CDAR_10351 [Caerostris darwini]|uniref:Secreted protein n=1 Tax=Caerostris darwini TaxID=1538125 RepID=A0AAV4RXY9_9ARAC|nr:hypothetical protein CDAR_10351 [Caerostris darwini]
MLIYLRRFFWYLAEQVPTAAGLMLAANEHLSRSVCKEVKMTSHPLVHPSQLVFHLVRPDGFAFGTVFRPRAHSLAEDESRHYPSPSRQVNPMNYLVTE